MRGAGDEAELVATLLERVFKRPAAVLGEVDALIDEARPTLRCGLLRVKGNAYRELRRIAESVEQLEQAHALALHLADATLEAESGMSLAASLSYIGEFDRSIELADRSITLLDGDRLAVATSQRAGLLRRAGRYGEAEVAFTHAEILALAATDRTIVGDVWMNRGVMHGWAGKIEAAEADTRRAMDLFASVDWRKRAADMRHNLGWLAIRRGDLVDAFRLLDVAESEYRRLDGDDAVEDASLIIFPDRCEALLAAGLVDESLAVAERAIVDLGAGDDQVDLGEALMLASRCALLRGDHHRAEQHAERAITLFGRHRRRGWWAAAALLAVTARLRSGRIGAGDVELVEQIIDDTRAAGLRSTTAEARVVLAELALGDGRPRDAIDALLELEGETLAIDLRCRAALVSARALAATGLPDRAAAVCAHGVDEFASATSQLGGSEIRASVALHVADLADLGLALALLTTDPASILHWSERQRASALDAPPVRPPNDPALADLLTQLRSVSRELDADGGSARLVALERRSARLRDAIARRARQVYRQPEDQRSAPSFDGLQREVGATWVSYVRSAGRLLAIVVDRAGARWNDLGALDDALDEVDRLVNGTAMHLATYADRRTRDREVLFEAARRVGGLLVDPLDLPDGGIIVSPTAGVHDVPWALLPGMGDRSISIAPSIAVWRRCASVPSPNASAVAVVAGPRLALAEREAASVAGCYESALVLTHETATVDAVRTALNSVDLAHVVCHGRFAATNPMFSSLELADGPMFVHDLERLVAPPRAAVLSACRAGRHATPAGREMLGMTASLLQSGLRWVIAGTAPIPDDPDMVDLMVALHSELASGSRPAAALQVARGTAPVLGASLSCFGAN